MQLYQRLRTGPLVKSCIRTVDCTEQTQFDPPIWTLDSMPDVECWPVRARARRKAQHADMYRVLQDVNEVFLLLFLLVTVPGICCVCTHDGCLKGRNDPERAKKRCTYAYRIATPAACGLVALLLVLVSYPTCSVITGSESLKP